MDNFIKAYNNYLSCKEYINAFNMIKTPYGSFADRFRGQKLANIIIVFKKKFKSYQSEGGMGITNGLEFFCFIDILILYLWCYTVYT